MGRGVRKVIGFFFSAPGRTWRISLGLAGLALLLGCALNAGLAGRPHDPGPFAPTSFAPSARPRPSIAPSDLQAELEARVAAYGEPVGVAVSDVDAGWIVQVAGDEAFPQQSVSKLWVALTLLDGVDRGLFRLSDPVTMGAADRSVFFQPVVGSYGPDGYATTLDELLRRALIESDNAAADRLVRYVGGAAAIQATLQQKGLRGILAGGEERDLQSKIAGLDSWQESYGQGNNFKAARARLSPAARDVALAAYLDDPPDGAQPRAVAAALAALKRGELLRPGSTALLLSLMTQATTGPLRLKGGLPLGWTLAHKTGTGQDWRDASVGINDVGLMTAPDGRAYAIAVMIRRTAKPVPDRLAFMQGVASAVVRHWELHTSGWAQAPSLGPPAPTSLPEQGRLRWAR